MKRLIVKIGLNMRLEERADFEAKIQRQWQMKEAVIIPYGFDYEIVEDGTNEITEFLDKEIERRKAAAEDSNFQATIDRVFQQGYLKGLREKDAINKLKEKQNEKQN